MKPPHNYKFTITADPNNQPLYLLLDTGTAATIDPAVNRDAQILAFIQLKENIPKAHRLATEACNLRITQLNAQWQSRCPHPPARQFKLKLRGEWTGMCNDCGKPLETPPCAPK